MDITSIIAIVAAIVAAYLVIKLIVSPIIKAITGVIILLVAIYLLQRFFGFNIDKILAPFGISLNLNKLGYIFNFISGPANYYIDLVKTFLHSVWQNAPETLKK